MTVCPTSPPCPSSPRSTVCKNPASTVQLMERKTRRIIGGQLSFLEEVRFLACIIKKGEYDILFPDYHKDEDKYLCGSSIIGSYWTLTAACCCDSVSKVGLINVYLKSGTTAWKASNEVQQHSHIHKIYKTIMHEDFSETTFAKDIYLVGVYQSFEAIKYSNGKVTDAYGKRIPIAGPKYNYKDGVTCTVYGFGVTRYKEDMELVPSDKLKKVDVKLINHQQCENWYDERPEELEGLVGDTTICAGWPNQGGKDACRFDSGGPLVRNNVLIGIVSFGQGCGERLFPGVYTKVGLFRNWILNVEKTLGKNLGVIWRAE